MARKIDISIVIVNYKVKEYVSNLLSSIRKAADEYAVQIFVVDNDSGDDSVSYLQQRHPDVSYIANKDNLGFGKANNQAIKQAKGEFTLIINPDTIWKDNYLIEVEKMKKFYFDNNLSNILMLVNKSRSFDKRFKGDFTLKDNLVSKENINNYIFTGCQILNKSIFSSINKDKFSISEVWDKEINNKQLYGIESVNEFLHVTDLDIYKKLSS